MISTQPGSTSLSSFKIISLEEEIPKSNHGNNIGPFGDQDDEQVRHCSSNPPDRTWVSDYTILNIFNPDYTLYRVSQ